jgi:hypothetical protein
MNVEIGAEAALFLEKEYMNGILVAAQVYEYGNWEQGRAFLFLGIHNSKLLCSVEYI